MTNLALAFSRKTVAVILAAVLLAYVLSILFLVGIARIQDQKSLAQTTQFVRLLLQEKESWIEKTVSDYADWGAAYKHLHNNVDVSWAYERRNVGANLLDDLSIEYAAVFDAAGREVYSIVDGQLMKEPAVGAIRGVKDLVDRARTMGAGNAANGILVAHGDPVFAAARVISTGADPSVVPDGAGVSVLLFGDRLTHGELEQLRKNLGLEQLQLVEADRDSAPSDGNVLRSSAGDAAFLIEVMAPRPGREMLHAIIPSFAVIAAMFGGMLWWLGRQGTRDAYMFQEHHRSLRKTAHFDAVTGLPNRNLFTQRLRDILSRPDTPVSVLFLDLDRFKPINDTFGHEAGDFVLAEIGRRLEATTKAGDFCARLGGDEFVIVTLERDESSLHRLCKTIIQEVSADITYDAHELIVGVSIGIALAQPNDALEDVLRRADKALYDAKTSGRSRYRWYSEPKPPERALA
ncbi:diguanylate cyclase [Hyphomicrobium sp.]|uniref:diguanylate cyclase domain-containing protein n=1 Tax=Hyphomicrobium sp. TaxID=82 RepID=UPI0025BA2438|nr:diguanylate cyclase [Hyphomicrobium sp.]MCC7250492.1 diguanylate cyclase [Hyphomicrobium sp.]